MNYPQKVEFKTLFYSLRFETDIDEKNFKYKKHVSLLRFFILFIQHDPLSYLIIFGYTIMKFLHVLHLKVEEDAPNQMLLEM